jgi:hypothetical protein
MLADPSNTAHHITTLDAGEQACLLNLLSVNKTLASARGSFTVPHCEEFLLEKDSGSFPVPVRVV